MPRIRFETSDREVSFPDGDEVNLLRVAIRNECGIPFKCASGNCGTDRVRVLEGADRLIPPRRRERDRLGELADQGYRLACQTYVSGDVTVAWDPDQRELEASGKVYDRLRQVWLATPDTAGSGSADE
jgi:ferredoxin